MNYRDIKIQIFVVLLATTIHVNADGPLSFLASLIQNNVAGPPVIHERSEWNFDPEAGLQRRQLFQEVNGYRAEKLIERLGLGIDGKHRERLAQQRARDVGLLGGTIFHLKSGLNTIDRV